MLTGTRVLVTGGAGYIGSRVTAYLLGRGARVTVLDSLVYGASGLLSFIGDPSFQFLRGDVRDANTLRSTISRHDLVLHLAAIVGEPACALDSKATEAVNRDAAIAAMEIADQFPAGRFLFFSTCSNYGAAYAGTMVDETAPLDPLSLYAKTKVAAEESALSAERKMTTTVLRLGTICGLSGRMRFDLLVNDMARAAALGHPIEVYKPQSWRPYLHIADVDRIIETAFSAPEEKVRGRVFNIVGENYQKSDLVDLVRKHFPKTEIRIIEAAPDNRDYRVSASRVKDELGFEPRHTVEEAFLQVAQAVTLGAFVNPLWPGFSAIPLEPVPHA